MLLNHGKSIVAKRCKVARNLVVERLYADEHELPSHCESCGHRRALVRSEVSHACLCLVCVAHEDTQGESDAVPAWYGDDTNEESE